MAETAENLADKHSISREDVDAYALRSQQAAAAAWEGGQFVDEVIPVPVKNGAPLNYRKGLIGRGIFTKEEEKQLAHAIAGIDYDALSRVFKMLKQFRIAVGRHRGKLDGDPARIVAAELKRTDALSKYFDGQVLELKQDSADIAFGHEIVVRVSACPSFSEPAETIQKRVQAAFATEGYQPLSWIVIMGEDRLEIHALAGFRLPEKGA